MIYWSRTCLETNKTTETIKPTWNIEMIEPMGGKSPPQGVVRRGAVEGIYLWLTTATPAIYKYRRGYIPIKPSDALGSTPLTIRNIAMGNLLLMTKSVSRRRIRRDAGASSLPPNEQFGQPRRYEWLLFITYMTILRPSSAYFRC